ncbi:MAG: hypothetical protein MJ245_00225 [Clostridia bacterium]|nr:hypothetical protein [Clostridia bacterium]
MNPFEIRKQPAYEVFLLVRRLNEYSTAEVKIQKQKARRPAGDDWF